MRSRFHLPISITAALLALVAGAVATNRSPLGAQDGIEDHFKYGSIGTEKTVGVPYAIWRVLPIVFEDKLPKRPGTGYERLGFVNDGAARDRPIGTTNKGGRVGLNCATCHVGTVRDDRGERAEDRPGHAGAPDGPAGLRAIPDRGRRRSAVQQRHPDRRHSESRIRPSRGGTG